MSDPDFNAILSELEKLRSREKEILTYLEVQELTTEYKARRNFKYDVQIDELDQIRSKMGRVQTELITKVLTDVRQATRDTSKAASDLNQSVTSLNSSVTNLYGSSRRLESFTVNLLILTIVLLLFTAFSTGLELYSAISVWWVRIIVGLVPIAIVIIFLKVIFPKLRKLAEVPK